MPSGKKFAFPSDDPYHRPTDEYVNSLPSGSRFGLAHGEAAGVELSQTRLHGLSRVKNSVISKVQSGRKGQRLMYEKN